MCGACSSGFPVIGEIPWLFADPRQALAEWRGRLTLLSQHLASEAAAMRAAQGAMLEATRRRLAGTAAAYEDQIARLRTLPCSRPRCRASSASVLVGPAPAWAGGSIAWMSASIVRSTVTVGGFDAANVLATSAATACSRSAWTWAVSDTV